MVVSHTHSITDPGHRHLSSSNAGDTGAQWNPFGFDAGQRWDGGFGGGAIGSSTYSSTNTTAITVNTAGVSGTNANLPPYYALCYIMKT